MNLWQITVLASLGLSAACGRGKGPIVPRGDSVVFNGDQALESGPKAAVDVLDQSPASLTAPLPLTCAIQDSAKKSAWALDRFWRGFFDQLKNPEAYWINVTEVVGTTASSCAPLLPDQRLLLVSSFELKTNQTIHLEMVADDNATVQLWQDMKSTALVFTGTAVGGFSKDMALRAGKYALVFDLVDSKGIVSALIGSVIGPAGEIIRQTEAGSKWCAYLINKTIDVNEFITNQASQQACMAAF